MFQFTKEKINKDFFLSSKFINGAILTFVLAVLLYGFMSFYSGRENLLKAFSFFPFKSHLFLILSLVSLGWFLRGLRWHYYVRKTKIKDISFFRSLHLFLASFSLTVSPGKAGELVKSIFLKKENNVPISKTAGILLTERLMDLIAVLILSLSFVFFDKDQAWLFLICLCLVLFILAFLYFESLHRSILNFFKRFSFLKGISEKFLFLFKTSRELLKSRSFVFSIFLSLLTWSMEAVSFFLVVSALNLPVSLFVSFFIYSISTIAGAISMLPGGLGGTEGTMIGLLALRGISVSKAIPAVLIIRLLTLWYIPVVALFFMVGLIARKKL